MPHCWRPASRSRARSRAGASPQEYYEPAPLAGLPARRAVGEAARGQLVVPLTLRWYDGTIGRRDLGNDNSLCLYVCGSFEPNEFAFLDKVLKPGMVFFDVGANDGYYTLFAAQKVGTRRPRARRRAEHARAGQPAAQHRAQRPRQCDRRSGGAWRGLRHRQLRLAQGAHSGHNTLGNFAHDGVQCRERRAGAGADPRDVVAEQKLGRVDVIKIDVEGAEASVIAGGKSSSAAMRPVMLLEISDKALRGQGSDAQKLIATVRDEMEYEIAVFSAQTGRLELLDSKGDLSLNVVAMPRERVAQILATVGA